MSSRVRTAGSCRRACRSGSTVRPYRRSGLEDRHWQVRDAAREGTSKGRRDDRVGGGVVGVDFRAGHAAAECAADQDVGSWNRIAAGELDVAEEWRSLAAILPGNPLVRDRRGDRRLFPVDTASTWGVVALWRATVVAEQHFRNFLGDSADVDECAARADAALQPDAGLGTHAEVHVDTLPSLDLFAVVARQRHEVVRRPAETRRSLRS